MFLRFRNFRGGMYRSDVVGDCSGAWFYELAKVFVMVLLCDLNEQGCSMSNVLCPFATFPAVTVNIFHELLHLITKRRFS